MGLTTALFTGLTGLTVNSQAIAITGNNIANANTTGFKASRAEFETSISQNLKPASGPTTELGGTNPLQAGLGVRLGSIFRDFSNGSLTPTGVNTDMAVEGNGFFIVKSAGSTQYTRAGTMRVDRDYNLVDPNGARLQGYAVDNDFNIVPGIVDDLTVPLGSVTLAESTKSVSFSGNLNAAGDAAMLHSVHDFDALLDASSGGFASGATLMSDLQNLSATTLFTTGDIITVTNAEKGGAELPAKTFEVGPSNTTASDSFGTTVQDYLDFLTDALGIDTAADAATGAAINPATGVISITGNTGEANDLTVDTASIIRNIGSTPFLPFVINKTQAADGESARTSFVVFDSLGSALNVEMSLVMESKSNSGTMWRFYAQSADDSDLSRVLGSGTLEFDNNGRLINVVNGSFIMDRANTGAATPQLINVNFNSGEQGGVSALAQTPSQFAAFRQDGSPIGTLDDFTIGEDGTITGVFSNGLLRNLGQVVLASFSNPQGLLEVGSNLYAPTINSGVAVINTAGKGGSGRIVGGALELSNVDLSKEFINLINASTGFTASSRVLTTSERLMQELLSTIR